jgi:hypothetical protein
MAGYALANFDLKPKPQTSRLFLAEGDSEVGYIEAALTLRGADPAVTTILCFKGINKMAGHAQTIAKFLKPGMMQQLIAIGVLADCENDPNGRLRAVIECGKAFGFPNCATDMTDTGRHSANGRKFAVSLSPAPGAQGRIEALVRLEKSQDATMGCIGGSLGCIEAANHGRQVDEKAIVQMFISAAMNSSIAGIGHAFRAGLFDVTHAAYKNHLGMIDYILA